MILFKVNLKKYVKIVVYFFAIFSLQSQNLLNVYSNAPNDLEDFETTGRKGKVPKIVGGALTSMLVERTICAPLDTIIVRQQYSTGKTFRYICKKIFKEEGWVGFYRGYRTQVVSSVPISMVFGLNSLFYQHLGLEPLPKGIIGGAVAAASFAVVYNPFDMYRTWLITHKEVYKPTRYSEYYRGIGGQFMRAFLYSFVGISGTRYLSQRDDIFPAQWGVPSKLISASLITGSLAQILMSPVDLVKTRVMADKDNRGAFFHFQKAAKEGSLCQGTLTRLLRHGPATGIIMAIMYGVTQENTLANPK